MTSGQTPSTGFRERTSGPVAMLGVPTLCFGKFHPALKSIVETLRELYSCRCFAIGSEASGDGIVGP